MKSDGTLWSWGANYYGQLGLGVDPKILAPTQLVIPGNIAINNGASYTKTASVTLKVTATDKSGISEMQFSNDGSDWTTSESYATTKSWSLTLGDGSKTVYAKFKDNAGNWSPPFTATIVFDTDLPTGSFEINNGQASTASTSVILNISATDANGISGMRFSNDGTTWSSTLPYSAAANWTLTTGSGTKTVYGKFKDNAGNWSEETYTASITLDTIAPAVTISSPVTGSTTSNTTPLLLYSVSDGTVVVKVDSNIVSKGSGSILDLLSEGTHTLLVESTDAVGNIGFAESFFTIDTTPPSVTISSPVSGPTNSTTPTLIYSVSDGTVAVTVDGTAVQTLSGEQLSSLPTGTHTVRVEATDSAGNTATTEVVFIVDTTAPIVTLASPHSGTTANTRPRLLFDVSDGTVTVKVDGVTVSKASGERLDDLSNGQHTVRVESLDKRGISDLPRQHSRSIRAIIPACLVALQLTPPGRSRTVHT